MPPDGSLAHSQQPAHLSVSWDRSIKSESATTLLKDPFWYYPPVDAWVFQVVSFPHILPLKPCMHLSPPPFVLHAPPQLRFLDLMMNNTIFFFL